MGRFVRRGLAEDERLEDADAPRADAQPVIVDLGPAGAGSTPAAMTPSEYAEAIGTRVTLLIERALAGTGDVRLVDPDTMAGVIAGLVIDRADDPEHNEIADLVAPLWSADRTRRALGSPSRAAMADRRRAGTILGLKTTDGDIFYPVSQFETFQGAVRVKPALREFFRILRDQDPWTVAVLMRTPTADLEDRCPVDWAADEGGLEVLAEYARTVNAEFSR